MHNLAAAVFKVQCVKTRISAFHLLLTSRQATGLRVPSNARAAPRLPGSLPADFDSEIIIGLKMPPARADVEGMAGQIRVSASDSPYDRPRVDLPNHLTNMLAIRSPSPVFSNPAGEAAVGLMQLGRDLQKRCCMFCPALRCTALHRAALHCVVYY